jgi:hypothetical protein
MADLCAEQHVLECEIFLATKIFHILGPNVERTPLWRKRNFVPKDGMRRAGTDTHLMVLTEPDLTSDGTGDGLGSDPKNHLVFKNYIFEARYLVKSHG